jgi:hypothetical protein
MSGRTGAFPTLPAQPTQVVPSPDTMGVNALTRPPGLRRHCRTPSWRETSSTGRRLATTTSGFRGMPATSESDDHSAQAQNDLLPAFLPIEG